MKWHRRIKRVANAQYWVRSIFSVFIFLVFVSLTRWVNKVEIYRLDTQYNETCRISLCSSKYPRIGHKQQMMPKINRSFTLQAWFDISCVMLASKLAGVCACLEDSRCVSTNLMCILCPQLIAKLTSASVVSFWIPHAKVSHGAGGEAHAYLTDVIALQEDEELGLTFNAAVVLRASVTAFGAR